jgi:hypothetical protein
MPSYLKGESCFSAPLRSRLITRGLVAALALGVVGLANAQVTVYTVTVTNNSGSMENGILLQLANADSSMVDLNVVTPGNGVILSTYGSGFGAQSTDGNQFSATFDSLPFLVNFVGTFTADNPNVQFSSGMWTFNGGQGPAIQPTDVTIRPALAPEPAPFAALGLGLLPLLIRKRRIRA